MLRNIFLRSRPPLLSQGGEFVFLPRAVLKPHFAVSEEVRRYKKSVIWLEAARWRRASIWDARTAVPHDIRPPAEFAGLPPRRIDPSPASPRRRLCDSRRGCTRHASAHRTLQVFRYGRCRGWFPVRARRRG